MSDYTYAGSMHNYPDSSPTPNTDIIDIDGIGTVDITKLSFVGVANPSGDFTQFNVIVDGLSLFWVTSEDAYASLLTAMRGRP